jgi:hypothetical protein
MTSGKRGVILFCVLAAAWTGDAFAGSCKDASLEDPTTFAESCTATAITEPSNLAWLLLVKICPPASAGKHMCDWQTWATNADMFPKQPIKDDPPKWPEAAVKEEFSCEVSVLKGLERRSNRPVFDYIVENGLWYQEGLADAWRNSLDVRFPPNAIAVAAWWKKIGEADRARYYWKTLEDGTICGLTNIDIKSRILPKWFYFSFEHVANPGRCDFSGCRDDFGQEVPFTPPKFTTGQAYQVETLTPGLLSFLGPDSIWKNYRLKGTQADFTTPDGRPTILAGSQIEGEFFPASSSCITCHSRAGFDSQGQNLYGHGEAKPFGLSPYGSPDPRWFYDTAPTSWQLKYRQADYFWSIPVNACPLDIKKAQKNKVAIPDGCL